MKLKNTMLVVDNIERSKQFYKELFGLNVIAEFEGNVILTEGLVLQDRKPWDSFLRRQVLYGHHSTELYFEENEMDAFLARLGASSIPVSCVHPLMEHEWGQRVIRLYDPDMHMIEVGESLDFVARRFLNQGMTPKEVAKKTQLPLSAVELISQDLEDEIWPEE